uniref:rac GTPase-activating protein 1-like n=1 Tax=Myxine glutinosa TaxID=7769 RepID=UPI00358EC1C9
MTHKVVDPHLAGGDEIPHSVKKDTNIEGVFAENNNCENGAVLKSALENHYFIGKTVIQLENCNACMTRILIGGFALRCDTCGILCHPRCKDVMPCVKKVRRASAPGYPQQDFNETHLMVLSILPLVVSYVNEIEQKGFKVNGLHVTPASKRLLRALKDEQLGVQCTTALSSISNVHFMCRLLLDYFWNLEEPMISVHHFQRLILAAEKRCQYLDLEIDALAETNRSTLAFIMRHLQNVLQHGNTGVEVLTQVFGPVLFGNSSYSKTDEKQCIFVMEYLLKLPGNYWDSLISGHPAVSIPQDDKPCQLQKT